MWENKVWRRFLVCLYSLIIGENNWLAVKIGKYNRMDAN